MTFQWLARFLLAHPGTLSMSFRQGQFIVCAPHRPTYAEGCDQSLEGALLATARAIDPVWVYANPPEGNPQ